MSDDDQMWVPTRGGLLGWLRSLGGRLAAPRVDPPELAAVEAAIQTMLEYTTWDGADPLDIMPTHVIVGPKNMWKAARLFGQQTVVRTAGDGGESNIHQGRLEVIVNQRLVGTYDDYWFLGAFGETMKPFIFQNREAITTAAQVDWSSPDMFQRGKMNFGAQARYGVGYFDPRLVYGAIL